MDRVCNHEIGSAAHAANAEKTFSSLPKQIGGNTTMEIGQ